MRRLARRLGDRVDRRLGAGSAAAASTIDLSYALLRDLFSDAQSTLVSSNAQPGAGYRNVTSSRLKTASSRLRGSGQSSSPAWGSTKIVYSSDSGGTGYTRVQGRTLCVLITPEDTIALSLALGWDTATNTSDPRTVGHGLAFETGSAYAITPGVKTGIDAGGHFARPCQYLVCVVLNTQGAALLLSTIAADSGNSMGYVPGVPQYPSAAVLWVDPNTTTTPLYPYLSYYDTLGYPDGHAVEDMREPVDVSSWSAADGMADFADRFTRADSNTVLGNSWATDNGTWGISSNQAYVVADSGAVMRAYHSTTVSDGIFSASFTMPGTGLCDMGIFIRRQDASNYIVLRTFSAQDVFLQRVVAGTATTIFSTSKTYTAGVTYRFTLAASGNKYKIWVDGVALVDGWQTDASSSFTTQTGMGLLNTGFRAPLGRWDNLLVYPLTVTLPAEITAGGVPVVRTPGATIGSDTFTQSNSTNLTSYTPASGGVWAAVLGTWTVSSNRATVTSVDTDPNHLNAITQSLGTADVEVSVDVITPSSFTANKFFAGLVLRYVDTSNYIVVQTYKNEGVQANSHEIELEEFIGGSGSVVHKVNLGNVITTSQTFTLKAQIKGDRIDIFWNGAPRITYYTQSGSPLGTRHGLYIHGQSDIGFWDNYTVKAL